jgi:subtilisin family serine protease
MPVKHTLNHTFRLRRIIYLMIIVLLLVRVTAFSSQGAASSTDSLSNSKYVPGSVLVKLKSEQVSGNESQAVVSSIIDQIQAHFPIASARPLFAGPFSDPEIASELGLQRIYLLELHEGQDVFTIIRELSNDPAVEYAEPDYLLTVATDDDYFEQQWGLHNTGQVILYLAGQDDADIDMPEAWDVTKGSQEVIVAIIDTGVDQSHPDFATKLVPGYNIIDDNENPQDEDGHGTHVAGIVAAATGNATGVAGVCWECKIMPLKALDTGGGYTSDVATAIRYAVDHGAHVINLSIEGESGSDTLLSAIRYAYLKNIPTVAAMGNWGTDDLSYPAAYPETIAVGATDKFDLRAEYSNYGEHIDLVAPGSEILSTYLSSQYGYMSGTSMSTPHVAGVLGLMRSMSPHKTVEELRTILAASADDLGDPGRDIYYGAGRLNAYQSLRNVTYGVSISSVYQEGFGFSSDIVEYNLSLTNTGLTSDTYNLSLSDVAKDWEATLSETSLSLEASETAQIVLQVTIPADAESGESDSITVMATSQSMPSITSNASLLTTCVEEQDYSVSFSPNSQAGSGLPGKIVEYDLTLANTGIPPDTYNLLLSDPAEGWEANLPLTSLPLAGGETAQVILIITIPDDAQEGDSGTVTITATSETVSSAITSATLTTIMKYSSFYIPLIIN